MTGRQSTTEAARGHWRGVLLALGVPDAALRNQHGPCPICGGKDRFRWDNREGKGTFFCTVCGAGDGMDLAMRYTGRDFYDLASQIDGILGSATLPKDKVKQDLTPEQVRSALRELWASSQALQPDDPVAAYLARRAITLKADCLPAALRFAPRVRDGEGGIRPAMLAMLRAPGADRFCQIHRTFLTADGRKAEMERVRKMMPGPVPDGAAVPLAPWSGGPLGIAEGIETALSAHLMEGVPVWAALSTSLLQKWEPPDGCDEVVIFGDSDEKFGGQAAAYALAHKLACRRRSGGRDPVRVAVRFPARLGTDWNDVLVAMARRAREVAT